VGEESSACECALALVAGKGECVDLKWFLIDFFQALAAGLMVGGTYGLMCVGLGIIFGVMRVVNFARRLHDARHVHHLLSGDGVRRTAFWAPMRDRRRRARPIVFVVGGCCTAS
jgi:hypothetical protein